MMTKIELLVDYITDCKLCIDEFEERLKNDVSEAWCETIKRDIEACEERIELLQEIISTLKKDDEKSAKKVKELTLGDAIKICKSHHDCYDCQLRTFCDVRTYERKSFAYIDECFNLDYEIKEKENA